MSPGPNQLHEDSDLLSLLREGNQQAFQAIYDRYAKQLFLRAYQKTGGKEISEDILQEVFAALWMRRQQLEIRGSLGAYLQGALDNKIIDHYRQASMHLKHLDHLTRLMDQTASSPIEKMNYKEQESALHAYISHLSEKMRAIFILSRYDDLSTDEISRKLSLSNQTVRNQISKALKILRAKVQRGNLPHP